MTWKKAQNAANLTRLVVVLFVIMLGIGVYLSFFYSPHEEGQIKSESDVGNTVSNLGKTFQNVSTTLDDISGALE